MAPSIPTEVLTNILIRSLSPFMELHSAAEDDELCTLALVCRQWKDIIYNYPEFWTRISITPDHLIDVRLFHLTHSSRNLN